ACGNYLGDIPCNWTTTGTLNLTTGITSTSFTFVPLLAGETGTINASFNTTIFDATGIITVTDIGIDYIIIEDGFGNEVTTHFMDASETFTVWAIGYNNTVGVVGPVNVDWETWGILDYQTATASQLFTFEPIHAPTTGSILARMGILWDVTGVITVNPGPLAHLCIQDAPGGLGMNVTTHIMMTTENLTVWSIGYDAEWNYISVIPSNWTNTLNAQAINISTVFTFDPTEPGMGIILAVFNLTINDTTGLIIVNNALSHICIQDAPGGMGANVTNHDMTTDEIFTVWAVGFDSNWICIGNVNCNWQTMPGLESQTAFDTNTFTFSPTTPGSGFIFADDLSGHTDATGPITVNPGTLSLILIRDAAGGLGNIIGMHSMTIDDTLTLWAAGYDSEGNYI
ncbi:MAG: hypothetical protein KAX31_03290, partial [Thermoplasmata archaeon]|nr:hypothetical protein [Thermoplasmata archaeon]